jgi:c-di-AMP phosphodiesterase-like protein
MVHFLKKYLVNIQNPTWFFIGIILLILGSFVTIFDYPQIQYFENMDSEMYATLKSEQKEIHNRLIIEFSIGIVILLAGGALFVVSFFRNSKK